MSLLWITTMLPGALYNVDYTATEITVVGAYYYLYVRDFCTDKRAIDRALYG